MNVHLYLLFCSDYVFLFCWMSLNCVSSHMIRLPDLSKTYITLFVMCFLKLNLTQSFCCVLSLKGFNMKSACSLWRVAILLKSMGFLPVNCLENTMCYFYEVFFLSLFAVMYLLCRIIKGKFRFIPDLDNLSWLYGSSRRSWSREIWQIMRHVVSVCHYVYPVSQSAWCILIIFPFSSCNDAWLASPTHFCS